MSALLRYRYPTPSRGSELMNRKLKECRASSAFAFALALAFSSATQDTRAQTNDCRAELSAGASVTPLVARIGGIITITAVNASVPAVAVCDEAEVSGYIVKPNLNAQTVFQNGVIPAGACFSCPINPTC